MSLDWFYILIIGIIMMAIDFRRVSGDSTKAAASCGQYGFRCLNSKTFQICATPEDEDETEEPQPEETHDCREGFVCDEDNPAYCTPVDPVLATAMPLQRIARDSDYVEYEDLIENDSKRSNNENNDYNCGCPDEDKHPTTTTTATMETDTTTEAAPPEYDCETYGFFPDVYNNTLFWYCDVPANGQGFLIRHMLCGKDRVFDPTNRACVLVGTTRNVRSRKRNENKQAGNVMRQKKFNCCNKAPGRYADESNCRLYHYCLTKEFAPVEELTLICPRGTAYDPYSNKCTCSANYRCSDRKRSKENSEIDEYEDYPQEFSERDPTEQGVGRSRSNINCPQPIRFRDSNYCDGYFLCFDDQVIEMDCPEFYKFDDDMLECLPERIAHCE